MRKILIAIIIVIIVAAVYIFYADRIEATTENDSQPSSGFQGPPPGVPYVQGPTSLPPSVPN